MVSPLSGNHILHFNFALPANNSNNTTMLLIQPGDEILWAPNCWPALGATPPMSGMRQQDFENDIEVFKWRFLKADGS